MRIFLFLLSHALAYSVFNPKTGAFEKVFPHPEPSNLGEKVNLFLRFARHPICDEVVQEFFQHPAHFYPSLGYETARVLFNYSFRGEGMPSRKQLAQTIALTHLTEIHGLKLEQQQEICAGLSGVLPDVQGDEWPGLCLDAMLFKGLVAGNANSLLGTWTAIALDPFIAHYDSIEPGLYAMHKLRLKLANGADPKTQAYSYELLHLVQKYNHCRDFAPILPHLTEPLRNALSGECVVKMTRQLRSDALEKMPVPWLAMHSDLILRAHGQDDMGNDTAARLKQLSTSLLTKLIGGKGVHGCRALTTGQLNAIIASGDAKRRALLTGDCVGQIHSTQLFAIAAVSDLGWLPQDWLSKVPNTLSFAHEVEGYLKGKQLESVQAKVETLTPCAGLQLSRLSPGQVKALPFSCLRGILSHRQTTAADEKTIKAIPEAFWAAQTPEDLLSQLAFLPLRNHAHLTAGQLTAILRDPLVCAQATVAQSQAKASISPECFKAMPAAVRSQWLQLQGKKLQEGVLLLDADEVASLTFKDKQGNELVGMAALNAIFDSNLMNKLGTTGQPGPHPCRLVTGLEQMKEWKALGKNLSSTNCMSHTSVILSSWDDVKGYEQLMGLVPWEAQQAVVDEHWGGEWAKVPASLLGHLFQGGIFCRHAPISVLNQLTGDQWDLLTGPCLEQMREVGQLKQLDLLPPTAFSALTVRQAHRIGLGRLLTLSHRHWAQMSSEVPVGNLNVGSLLVSLKEWSAERVAVLPRTLLASLPLTAWADLAVEQLRALPASSLRSLSRRQVAMIPVKVLEHLRADQVEQIGLDHAKTTQDPIHVLRTVRLEDAQAQQALKQRSWAQQLTQSLLVASSLVMLLLFIST